MKENKKLVRESKKLVKESKKLVKGSKKMVKGNKKRWRKVKRILKGSKKMLKRSKKLLKGSKNTLKRSKKKSHICEEGGAHLRISFWQLFYPPKSPKNQNFEKLNLLEVSSFYTCVRKITIIWCTVPEILSETDKKFCHFGWFFALLPPP